MGSKSISGGGGQHEAPQAAIVENVGRRLGGKGEGCAAVLLVARLQTGFFPLSDSFGCWEMAEKSPNRWLNSQERGGLWCCNDGSSGHDVTSWPWTERPSKRWTPGAETFANPLPDQVDRFGLLRTKSKFNHRGTPPYLGHLKSPVQRSCTTPTESLP